MCVRATLSGFKYLRPLSEQLIVAFGSFFKRKEHSDPRVTLNFQLPNDYMMQNQQEILVLRRQRCNPFDI